MSATLSIVSRSPPINPTPSPLRTCALEPDTGASIMRSSGARSSCGGDLAEDLHQHLGRRDVRVMARVDFVGTPALALGARKELTERITDTGTLGIDIAARHRMLGGQCQLGGECFHRL